MTGLAKPTHSAMLLLRASINDPVVIAQVNHGGLTEGLINQLMAWGFVKETTTGPDWSGWKVTGKGRDAGALPPARVRVRS